MDGNKLRTQSTVSLMYTEHTVLQIERNGPDDYTVYAVISIEFNKNL